MLLSPWRKLEKDPWSEEIYNKLKREIQSHKLCKDTDIENINILLVGQVSAGKSSFFNSVESVFAGHVTTRANSGEATRSLTTQYRQYVITAGDSRKKKPIKFKFCDSMGLEAGFDGLSANDVGKILDGNVEELAQLSQGGLMPGCAGYNANPTEADRIHCLAFIINSLSVSMMDCDIVKKIKDIKLEANGRNLYPIVILTRIDDICTLTENDTSKVFYSSEVLNKVKEISKTFGIDQKQVYPVRNYNIQTECELDMDILILRAQRQILRYSDDFIRDRLARTAAEDKIVKKKMAEMVIREKKKKTKKQGNTSDEEDEDDNENSESGQDTESNSDSSVEPEVSKKNRSRGPAGDFSDSDYFPSKSRDKPKGSKRPPSLPKAPKAPPALPKADRKGIVLADFTGDRDDGEISRLREGEEVTEITADRGGWTLVRNSTGKEGNAPTDYIKWTSGKGARPPPRLPKSRKKWCAVDDYTAEADDEVDLYYEEKVEELEPDNGGWTKVKKEDGMEGIVPTDFLGHHSSHSKQLQKKPPKPRPHVPANLPKPPPQRFKSQRVPSPLPEQNLQSQPRKAAPPALPNSNMKPPKNLAKPGSPPTKSPKSLSAPSAASPSAPSPPPPSPPPPPPPPSLLSADITGSTSTPAKMASLPTDHLQAIRNAGGVTKLRSITIENKGEQRQEPDDFMGALKSKLSMRRSVVNPDLSEMIPYTEASESDHSDHSDTE